MEEYLIHKLFSITVLVLIRPCMECQYITFIQKSCTQHRKVLLCDLINYWTWHTNIILPCNPIKSVHHRCLALLTWSSSHRHNLHYIICIYSFLEQLMLLYLPSVVTCEYYTVYWFVYVRAFPQYHTERLFFWNNLFSIDEMLHNDSSITDFKLLITIIIM